jgi:hypothetical protein
MLSPVGLALAGLFRLDIRKGGGATYDYAKPDLLSMASVFFRFAGLSGYAPNRHYDLPFRPYLGVAALSTAAFAASLAAVFLATNSASEL